MMNREAFNDQTEDGMSYVADIHTITPARNRKENWEQRFHYHNCFQIMILQRGGAKVMVNYMIKELKAGDVLMLAGNLPHALLDVEGDDYRLLVVHVPQIILQWPMEGIPELSREHRFVKESKCGYLFSSAELCRKVVALTRKMQTDEGFMRISHLYRLIHLLSGSKVVERLVESRGANADFAPTLTDRRGETAIDRTFRFLYQHFTEEHTLDEIAAYALQNKTALCRAFKRATGYSIFQFINRLRIEHACELIRNTGESITRIAYQVGYSTFSHFNLQFNAVMGMPPSAYRKRRE